MENAALEFIKVIAGNMDEEDKPLCSVLDVLEDGEALAYLGVSDEDLDIVEEAHAMVSDWIKDGKRLFGGVIKMDAELAECLDGIAAGKMWSESTLMAAINKHYISDAEKAVLRRYINGSYTGVDHVTLQDIARAIRNNRGLDYEQIHIHGADHGQRL